MGRKKVSWRHKKELEELIKEAEFVAYEAYKAQRNGDEEMCMKYLCKREDLLGDFFDKYRIDYDAAVKIEEADYYGWKRAYAI